jgi:signal transduction histidine kinase
LSQPEPAEQAELELKLTLQQIERAKHEWESTVDSVSQFIGLLDEQGRLMRTNRTVERWGLAPVMEVKDRNLHALFHPNCYDLACNFKTQYLQAWEKLVGEGLASEWEIEDGVLNRHFHFQIQPIWAQPHQAESLPSSFAVIVVDDITARKQAEAALRQAYDELERRVQERTAELAEKVKEEHRQREIATILAEVVASVSLSFTKDELLDHILLKLHQLIAYDSAAIFLVRGDRLDLRAGRGFEASVINQYCGTTASDGLFQAMFKSKSYILIQDTYQDNRYQRWVGAEKVRCWVGAPLLVAQEMIGYLAVDHYSPRAFCPAEADVIQAFAHQVAQTIHNARLFADLKEAQAQLVEGERLAALGQMAATVAHELRNPLMNIRLGVEHFSRDFFEADPRRRYVARVQANIDRIDRIVEDILHVARAPQPTLTPGLLQNVIEAEVTGWEFPLAEKKIICRLHLADHLPPLPLDPDQMSRALSNLISNSIDALPPGGEIEITLGLVDQNQVITLADNGPGIAPDHLPQIFEPFFTTKSRGTGLGLYIIKRIIEYHHGTITVWSEVGQGTKFTLAFPNASEATHAG